MQKVDGNLSFLDLLVHRTTQGFEISIYRKSVSTDMLIHFASIHPIEHKRAALQFLFSRMHQLPSNPRNKDQEWNMILCIAKTKWIPLSLCTKLNIGMLPIRQHDHVYLILLLLHRKHG
jgi:hypothetical protein